jgi:hypothetical protein
MIEQSIIMQEIIPGYENRMKLEEREKVEKNKYIKQSLDHNLILISPEINDEIVLNRVFETVIKTALSEITDTLSDEFRGKISYIIDISVDEWTDTVIEVKIPIDDPEYIIQLWKKVDERVRKRIRSISEDDEIHNIVYHLDTVFRILE